MAWTKPALLAATVLAGLGVYSVSERSSAQPSETRPVSPLDFHGERAVTAPSYDAVMGFPFPAQIKEILVKDGERIRKGQLLIRARDDEPAAAVELARIQAESDLQIEYAREAKKLADIELASFAEAESVAAGSRLEKQRAELNATTKAIELDLATQRKAELAARLTQAQAGLDQYRLTAEVDGIVEQVRVKPGHSINETEPAVRVVSVDPLHIDVPTPTGQTLTLALKEGSPAWILIGTEGMDWRILTGTVHSVSPLTDAASDRRRVKVEVANPDQLPPGMMVYVRFTEPEAQWRDRIVASATREGTDK